MSRTNWFYQREVPLQRLLKGASHLPQSFSLEHLCTYQNMPLALSLIADAPKQTAQRLGENALLWAWAESTTTINDSRREDSLLERYTKKSSTILRLCRAMNYINDRFDLRNMLRAYDLFAAEDIIRNTCKDLSKHEISKIIDSNLKRTQIEEYHLELVRPPDEAGLYVRATDNGNLTYEMHLDAPIGFLISYHNKPQAVGTFTIDRDSVVIQQLQGLRGRKLDGSYTGSWGLVNVDWQSALVDACDIFAKKHGFPHLAITSAIEHASMGDYTDPKNATLGLMHAIRHYDWTAARKGFTYIGERWVASQGKLKMDRTEGATRLAAALPEILERYKKHI